MQLKYEFDPTIKALEPKFIELIRSRLGIEMHTHQSYELFKTVEEACFKFNCTPAEYLSRLLDCPNQSPIFDHLIAGITVGETYFFRDQQQMELLHHYLLPELIQNKRNQNTFSLRIWSAGCATGEEMYSVSMMLYELLPDIEAWTIKLLATDINTSALHKAIIGSFSDWSMRSTSDYFIKKYFCKEGRRFIILKKIRDSVDFDYLNLNENSYPSIFNGTNAQDLIICRNVLIYIDNESAGNIMRRINSSLVKGGYLMLGASDPIVTAQTDFIFHHKKGLLFSRPTEDKIEMRAILPLVLPTIPLSKQNIKKLPVRKIIKKKTEKITSKKMTPLIHQDLLARATELANLGKLEESLKLCEQGFKLDPTNKLNYFTYGLALTELDRLPEAEAAFRKTLFLDNRFVAAHFQLGLLLLRKNKHDAGLKCLKNALMIAETENPENMVPGSPGLCYQRLADILRNEIDLYLTIGT